METREEWIDRVPSPSPTPLKFVPPASECEVYCKHGHCDEKEDCVCEPHYVGKYCTLYDTIVVEPTESSLTSLLNSQYFPLMVIGGLVGVLVLALIGRTVSRYLNENNFFSSSNGRDVDSMYVMSENGIGDDDL